MLPPVAKLKAILSRPAHDGWLNERDASGGGVSGEEEVDLRRRQEKTRRRGRSRRWMNVAWRLSSPSVVTLSRTAGQTGRGGGQSEKSRTRTRRETWRDQVRKILIQPQEGDERISYMVSIWG